MAAFHAYAKLRLHTETTLSKFEKVMLEMCNLLRKFKKTVCTKYVTKELPREINARGRRNALLVSQGKAPAAGRSEARVVAFNLATYKAHSLPDYPNMIRLLGTTDNFTTQSVSLFRESLLICITNATLIGRTRTQTSQRLLWTYLKERIYFATHQA